MDLHDAVHGEKGSALTVSSAALRADVDGNLLLDAGLITLGEWRGLTTWRCVACEHSRPVTPTDEPRIHWEAALLNREPVHLELLGKAGLTERRPPAKVKSSLVDEHGRALYYEAGEDDGENDADGPGDAAALRECATRSEFRRRRRE